MIWHDIIFLTTARLRCECRRPGSKRTAPGRCIDLQRRFAVIDCCFSLLFRRPSCRKSRVCPAHLSPLAVFLLYYQPAVPACADGRWAPLPVWENRNTVLPWG